MNHKKKSIFLWAVFFFVILAASCVMSERAVAQTCTPQVLNPTFSTGDNMFTTLSGNDVVYSGGLAYAVSDNYGLRIVNVSDPANPFVVNPTFSGSDDMGVTLYGRGVFVSGSYAYVISDTYGLRIVNVSDPANPFVVNPTFTGTNNMGLTISGRGVFVSGSYAYVSTVNNGLRIVNVTDPANPFVINPTFSGSDDMGVTLYGRGVFVSGSYAYVITDTYGLRIVDVSDPANPFVVNPTYPAPNNMYTTQTGNGVYVSESLGLAYVVSNEYGLRIVDVSDPANPFVVNPTYPSPNDMYTTQSGMDVKVLGDYAYVVSVDYGLRIVDVSDPADPVVLNPIFDPAANMFTTISGHGVDVSCDYAYVVSQLYGLRIVDLSSCGCGTPPSPPPTGGPYTLQISSVAGLGTITSDSPLANAISCSYGSAGDCEEEYAAGTVVDLVASPNILYGTWVFTGWGGACSGTDPSIQVTMNSNKTCTATFELASVTLSKSAPSTIQFGDTFDYVISYDVGTVPLTDVVITDTLPSGVTFVSASNGGTESNGVVTWDLGSLSGGASGSVTLTVGTSCFTPSPIANNNYNISSTETGVVAGPSVSTSFGAVSTGPASVSANSVPQQIPLISGNTITHTITLTDTSGQNQTCLRIPLSPGNLMAFDSLIDSGGGTVSMRDEYNWEWRGDVPANGSTDITFTTVIEDCLSGTRKDVILNNGMIYVFSGSTIIGSTTPPGPFPVQRPVTAGYSALSLGPPQYNPVQDMYYQVARGSGYIDFQVILTNQFSMDQPNVSVNVPIPPGLIPAADPPFIAPTDPGAAFDNATNTISWTGTIPGNQTITVTFQAALDAGASCREASLMSGSRGTCDDIWSNLTILNVPPLPAEPYLIGLSGMNGLYTWKPGLDSGFQELMCMPGEIYNGTGKDLNGDIWVAGLPNFRFNPETLDFEIIDQDVLLTAGLSGALQDVAVDNADGTLVLLRKIGSPSPSSIVKRYDPFSNTVADITSGLPAMNRVVVDPDGMIAGMSQSGLIRIDPTDPNNYQTYTNPVYADPTYGFPTTMLTLDTDGNYLVESIEYSGGWPLQGSILKVDRSTGLFTEVIPDIASVLTAFPYSSLFSSDVGPSGEILLGFETGLNIGQIERSPSISGQYLAALGTVPPSPSPGVYFGWLTDLEYISILDTDGDGIPDDGDGSGISGDNTCIGGNTTNCDDNCVYTPNANQADSDNDGVGAVCDIQIYGAGMNTPTATKWRASMSLNVDGAGPSGLLKYYYTRQRVSLQSTTIMSVSETGGTAMITGIGDATKIEGTRTTNCTGCNFTALIQNGSPDKMDITIGNGNFYSSPGGLKDLDAGDFTLVGE
jgi:uncharacterized repeat protein (TIGR01451 family)